MKKKKSELTVHTILIHSSFKNFPSGERIQKGADSYAGFIGYVSTEAEKFANSIISGYVFMRLKVNRDGWSPVDLTL